MIGVVGQESVEADLPAIESPGFAPVSPALAEKTQVPLVIPATLPNSYTKEVAEFFCTVDTLELNEYEVTIGFDKDCHGGNACRIGSFSGMRSREGRITGSRNFPFDARRAKRIKLHGGIYGYFVEAECGANCNDSKVYWRQGDSEYMVGLKAQKMKEVVELANSAIRNSRAAERNHRKPR